MRGCRFAESGTPCGPTSCQDGVQSGLVCNGEGGCIESEVACGDYGCESGRCLSSCETNDDCASTAYCDDGDCRPLAANGESCTAAAQCESGICADGVCCATTCDAPLSCETGECLCNGVTCSDGEECTVFFLDQDGDGYAASSEYDVAGCTGSPPPDLVGRKYIDSKDAVLDCDDTDPDVHPNQKKYFTEPRADGTFDYDCDGDETKEYGALAFRSCTVCIRPRAICSIGLGYSDDACNQVPAAFFGITPPQCGKPGTLFRCKITGNCEGAFDESESALQGCR